MCFFSSRRRHTRFDCDWSSDVCSSDLELEDAFPYEETRDQLSAIDDVKRDMEQPKPMDRLICGDVGYGKTEIAIRAAFKAVVDGKHEAGLVPDPLLAELHDVTCTERHAAFPVHVPL